MKKMKLVSRQICIEPKDWQKYLELREKVGASFSTLARIALQEYLQKVGEKNEKRKSQEEKDCR